MSSAGLTGLPFASPVVARAFSSGEQGDGAYVLIDVQAPPTSLPSSKQKGIKTLQRSRAPPKIIPKHLQFCSILSLTTQLQQSKSCPSETPLDACLDHTAVSTSRSALGARSGSLHWSLGRTTRSWWAPTTTSTGIVCFTSFLAAVPGGVATYPGPGQNRHRIVCSFRLMVGLGTTSRLWLDHEMVVQEFPTQKP